MLSYNLVIVRYSSQKKIKKLQTKTKNYKDGEGRYLAVLSSSDKDEPFPNSESKN
jgi:hypothetical protein